MVVFKKNRVIGFLLQIIAIGFQVKDCDISYFSGCLVEDFRHLFYVAAAVVTTPKTTGRATPLPQASSKAWTLQISSEDQEARSRISGV